MCHVFKIKGKAIAIKLGKVSSGIFVYSTLFLIKIIFVIINYIYVRACLVLYKTVIYSHTWAYPEVLRAGKTNKG